MATKPDTKATEELRALLEQEAGRWTVAAYDVISLHLAVTGLAHRWCGKNEMFWADALATIDGLDRLRASIIRHEAKLRERIAALGVEQQEGANAERLH